MTTGSNAQTNRKSWLSWGLPVLVTVGVIGIVAAITLVLCEFVGTGVSGEEFNPFDWNQRTFFYRQAVFSRRQIRGITRTTYRSSIGSYVTQRPWYPNTSSERWDLAFDTTATPDSLDWRAAPLTRLLEVPRFNEFWLDWSQKHKGSEKHLWLAVMELAQQNQYESIPLLFESVSDTQDDADVIAQVDQFMTDSYELAMKLAEDPQRRAEFESLAQQPFQQRLPKDD